MEGEFYAKLNLFYKTLWKLRMILGLTQIACLNAISSKVGTAQPTGSKS